MEATFSAPVFPGDAVAVEIWVDGTEARFRATARGQVVIDRGWAELRPQPEQGARS